jgi:DNA-binding NtrC family response regulator
MAQGVLLIEDEEILAKNIKRYLERRGYDVVIAGTAAEGLRQFEDSDPDLVLLDLNLPDLHGLKVLEEIRRRDMRVKVVCMTGHGSVQIAVDAMKGGAFDYLVKPVILSELKILIDKALGQERLEGALSYYNARDAGGSGLDKLLGNSPAMAALRKRIQTIVEAERHLVQGEPPAVLVRGETGTGKELVARAFHFEGPRRNSPFIELNCAALPVQLLESELFGYERGAFTDAKEHKIGLVEAAHGGTLFLDEIGDIEVAVQLKLLKLLEDRTVRRVGGLRDRPVDVRFISATNRPLEDLVAAGKFRSDLYYRLRVVTIDLPPLRVRSGDAELLAQHFLALQARRYGRSEVRFSERALDRIRNHSWPGNVRELRNVIEQAVLSAGDRIDEAHLAIAPAGDVFAPMPTTVVGTDEAAGFAAATPAWGAGNSLEAAERTLIGHALAQARGNVSHAAKLLGVSRDTLRYRMEKHGIG